MMKLSVLACAAAAYAANSLLVLQFENFGFDGSYTPVAALNDPDLDQCLCEAGKPVTFSGPLAPLNGEVLVHFRGPLILHNFAFYTSDNFAKDDSSLSDWTKVLSYDGTLAKNATFLTTAGNDSKCLGKALTYAGSDGISKANEPTVLGQNTLIKLNQEYVIFSLTKCGDLGVDGDCGVYRKGIPAYHGFSNAIKMFLFEFEMPTDNDGSSDSIPNFNMPAIWLLNAQIPRTSQYQTNATYVNCSCWRLGCGEFDIFEVMNSTDSGKLVSTIHDYQQTDDIETGRVVDGYIDRKTSGRMLGGVYFDEKSNAVVFMHDKITFNDTIKAADVNKWVKDSGKVATSDLSQAPGKDQSTKKGAAASIDVLSGKVAAVVAAMVAWFL